MVNDTTYKRWESFFDEHLSNYHSLLEFSITNWHYNIPVFHNIQKTVRSPSKLLEIGCGLGLSSIYLQSCGYTVTAVDNNPQLVERARETAAYFHSEILLQQADAFHLSQYYEQFDLVYSIGVLEHFDREITIQLLQEQAKCGGYVLLVVPTGYTEPITDERLYTISQLRKIFREAGLVPMRSFGYGNPKQLRFLHRILPHALFRILQNTWSLAKGLGVIGRSPIKG